MSKVIKQMEMAALRQSFEGVRDLGRQIQQLKEEGLTILLCEQNTKFAVALSDRAYVLEKGQVRFSGTIAELQGNEEVRRQYLAL